VRALRRFATLIHSTDQSYQVPQGLFLHVLSMLSIHDHPGNIFMRWVQCLCPVCQTVHQGVTLGSLSTSFDCFIRNTGQVCDTALSCCHRIVSSLHARYDWQIMIEVPVSIGHNTNFIQVSQTLVLPMLTLKTPASIRVLALVSIPVWIHGYLDDTSVLQEGEG